LEEEALFPEARRLRRRRWLIGLSVLVLLFGGVAALALLIGWSHSAPTHHGGEVAGGLPMGSSATLNVAGPLAVSPSGALYVTDVARDRVLVRLADGRFRVVAGDGQVGFSGDGGPPVKARLSYVSGLAFSPGGSLYIVDGGRVRVVSPNGVIRTVAGNGQGNAQRLPTITTGTPALTAELGSTRSIANSDSPLSIALNPSGQLYLATSSQLMRLTAAGTLDPVRAVVTSGPAPIRGNLHDLGSIAIDRVGNVEVSGVNGWAIWQLAARTGIAHQIVDPALDGQARRSGGNYSILERGPGGDVYGESGPTVLRIRDSRLVPTFRFTKPIRGEYFWLTYFAFGPNGTLYADEIPGDSAFEVHQQLVSVANNHVSLLWQQRNTNAGDSFRPR
jgi:hypothetical protein